ncbi:MAG TPA: GspH/FimT family pseudopilin [Usitatibacter sp.]|nr:GspH/FimT family pseudopilin [Usitatibacter sp.]
MRRLLRPAGGFTLIEILVVVAIVGIVLVVATVNLMPDQAQLARRDAAQLALDIEQAREAAWFGGLPTAVSLADGRLRRWRFAGTTWESEASKDRPLEGDTRVMSLHVDGEALSPAERLVFMPDGLGTPFRVALELRGHRWAIEGDAAGAVKAVER